VETDVIYGDGQYLIDGFGISSTRGRIISIGSSQDIIASLLYGLWVPAFSYLTRRSAVQRSGPWDESLKINEDFEYFLRMAIQGCSFFYKAGLTGLYRKHSLDTVSEKSIAILEKTRRDILAQAECILRRRGEFKENRVRAMVENYRRIARQVYLADIECFKKSLDDVLRLCPQYLPNKPMARFISKIIGFRNYERVAALISEIIYKNNRDWF
jgi:hypothetical protein